MKPNFSQYLLQFTSEYLWCDSRYVDKAKGKSDLHQKSFSNNWQKNWMFGESWAREQIWRMWVWKEYVRKFPQKKEGVTINN